MKKKTKIGIILAAVALAGIAIAAIVIGICIHNGVFLKPVDKVLLATKNTFNQTTPLVKAADISDYLQSGKYSVAVDGYNEDGASVEAIYAVTEKKQQFSGEAKLNGLPNFEFCFTLEDGMLSAHTPLLDDYELVYHYNEVATGAITGTVSSSQLSSFNDALTQLETLGSLKDSNVVEIGAVILKDIRTLEFEKADSNKFEVDDKKVKCKGYSVQISSDDVEKIYDDVCDEILKKADNIYVKNALQQADNEISEMNDMELTFYIRSNKLACIKIRDLECDNNEIEIRFKGGDTRWQNIDVTDKNGDVIAQLIGETNESVEKYSFMNGTREEFALSYDSKSGDLGIAADGTLYTFNYVNDGKTALLETYDFEGVTGKVTLTKKAEFQKYDAEKVIDIGKANTSEIQDFAFEVMMNPEVYDIIKKLF